MSRLSKETGSGLFHILSRPKPEYLQDYHDWYNSEHGPLRLTTNFVLNGYRYNSVELEPPVFLATYDVSRLNGFEEKQYTVLRENRSARESDVLESKIELLKRRFYKDISCRGTINGPAPVIMVVTFVVKDEHVEEMHRWYEKEHTKDISHIPGWRRSRRFQLVDADDITDGYTELLAIHDFDQKNGIGGSEHEVAKSRPWRMRILDLVESRDNKLFEFFHEFKSSNYRQPSGRVLDEASTTLDWDACWRVEGPAIGPAIVFLNSMLTSGHIWDEVISELTHLYPRYRYVLYNTRGYSSHPGRNLTIDTLTDDLADLLDALKIDQCFAVIGVSLGGVTALNFAARYPSRLQKFVACNCNAMSTEANTKAWRARQKLAEKSWDQFADQTIARWFTTASRGAQSGRLSNVKDGILSAHKGGFVECVDALCNFNLSDKIRSIRLPGLAVVGAHDGTLPATMDKFSKTMPNCQFSTIPDTGHLPMVEDPRAFVAAIQPIFERQGRKQLSLHFAVAS